MVGWRWQGGEGRVAWGQQMEVLSVLDLDEHCSYSPAGTCGSGLPPVGVAVMLDLLDAALAVAPPPDIRGFVGGGHYACEPMVAGLEA